MNSTKLYVGITREGASQMKTLEVIQPHDTWSVVDSSKLSEYMRCPRRFFYRYILGWSTDYPNNHLIFGSAWHLATEHFLREGSTPESLYEASRMFLEHYRKHFDESTDELFAPKTPANALESLAAYAAKYQSDVRKYITLHTEIAGVVSISQDYTLNFKIDAILRERESGKILFMDHKTSQRKYYDWGEHWIMSTQMLTYYHVLHCLYPKAEIEGGKVRTSFFYKAKPSEFDEILIQKTSDQMNTWITRVNEWMGRMEDDKNRLIDIDSPDMAVMRSFPMNDTSCFAFGQKCPYFDLCNSWSNPLQHCEDPPLGLNVSWWNPMELETIKEKVNLK